MPNTWDLKYERQLLLSMLEVTGGRAPSWPAVADRMDGAFTAEACRQHYNKIKRETKGGGAGSGEISAQATPSRRRTGGIAQPRKRKPANMEDDDDNAFPSVNSTPTKFAASSTNGTPSKDTKVKKLKEEDDIPAAPVFKVDEEGQEAVNLVSDDEFYN